MTSLIHTHNRRARKEKAKRRTIDVSNSALASAHAYSSLRKALNVKAQLLGRTLAGARGGRKQSPPLASVPEPGDDELEHGAAAAAAAVSVNCSLLWIRQAISISPLNFESDAGKGGGFPCGELKSKDVG